MKKIEYLAIATTAVVSLPAFAQSKNFEGSNLTLGISSLQLKESSDSISKNWNTQGNIEFTKFKSLNDSWLIGFGIGFDAGTLDSNNFSSGSGEIEYFSAGNSLGGDPYYRSHAFQHGTQKIAKLKNNLSASVIPAFAINTNSLLFARFSFNRARYTVQGGTGSWLNVDPEPSVYGGWEGGNGCSAYPDTDACSVGNGNSYSGSKYLNGIGWGLGLRHKFTENLFVQSEYKYVSYKHNAELDVKPKTQGYTLSIGYKF